MEDAKALVIYWREKGHGILKIYQELFARGPSMRNLFNHYRLNQKAARE
jgi:hemoglobin-like flavoprotein